MESKRRKGNQAALPSRQQAILYIAATYAMFGFIAWEIFEAGQQKLGEEFKI